MRRGNSWKIAVGLLSVFAIIALGVTIYLLNNLQNLRPPTDAGATGFTAESNYYDPQAGLFRTIPCSLLLNNGLINAVSNGLDNPLLEFEIKTISDISSVDNEYPKCRYSEVTGASTTEFTAQSPLSSYIDLSGRIYGLYSDGFTAANIKSEFFQQQAIKSVIDQGQLSETSFSYVFGISAINPQVCTSLLFDQSDRFAYIELKYFGYDCNSEQTRFKNKVYNEAISTFIANNLQSISTTGL